MIPQKKGQPSTPIQIEIETLRKMSQLAVDFQYRMISIRICFFICRPFTGFISDLYLRLLEWIFLY